MLNYEQIKKINMIQHLEKSGFVIKKTGNKFQTSLREESNPSTIIEFNEKNQWHWYDHGLKRGGDLIDLEVFLTGGDPIDIAKNLSIEYGLEIEEETPQQIKKRRMISDAKKTLISEMIENEKKLEASLEAQDFLEKKWGIGLEEAKKFKIGLQGDYLVFYTLDLQGKPCYWYKRSLNADLQYQKIFPKSADLPSPPVFFGQYQSRSEKRIAICEGQADAVALSKIGIPAVALGTNDSNIERLTQLLRSKEEIEICLDNDKAGIENLIPFAMKCHKINPKLVIKIIHLEGGKDPGEICSKGEIGQRKILEVFENAKTLWIELVRDLGLHPEQDRMIPAIEFIRSLQPLDQEVKIDNLKEITHFSKSILKKEISKKSESTAEYGLQTRDHILKFADLFLERYRCWFDNQVLYIVGTNEVIWKKNGLSILESEIAEYYQYEIADDCQISLTAFTRDIAQLICAKTGTFGQFPNILGCFIPFKNCMVEISTSGEISQRDFKQEDYLLGTLPVSYDTDAQDYDFLHLFAEWQEDHGMAKVLLEIVGSCMIKDQLLEKFYMLYGEGRNGKSLFLLLIEKLIGQENLSYIRLQDLSDKFSVSSVKNKFANLGGEISSVALKETTTIKEITGKTTVNSEEKYKAKEAVKLFATLVFSANELPVLQEGTYAIGRRAFLIPWNKIFVEGSPDDKPFLKQRIIEEDPDSETCRTLAKEAVNAISRLVKNDYKHSVYYTPEETLELWKKEANPLYNFIEDHCELDEEALVLKSLFFAEYCKYAKKRWPRRPKITHEKLNIFMSQIDNIEAIKGNYSYGNVDSLWRWKGIKIKNQVEENF